MITPSVMNLSSAAWASGIVLARKNEVIARQKTVYSGALDREHEEDPLVAREPPVDRVVDRGEREEAREDCVHRDQRVQETSPLYLEGSELFDNRPLRGENAHYAAKTAVSALFRRARRSPPLLDHAARDRLPFLFCVSVIASGALPVLFSRADGCSEVVLASCRMRAPNLAMSALLY